MTIDEIKRQAAKAARRGDIAKLDQLEIDYMKAAGVPLTKSDPSFDGGRAAIPAQPIRLFRGAGPNGETCVQWLRFDGVHVLSDIEGHLTNDTDESLPARAIWRGDLKWPASPILDPFAFRRYALRDFAASSKSIILRASARSASTE